MSTIFSMLTTVFKCNRIYISCRLSGPPSTEHMIRNLENLGAGVVSPRKIIQLQEASSLSLGAKRNISVENCQGEYFCQWDDDDWYHNRHLGMQLNELLESEREACVLRRWILYDQLYHDAYLSSDECGKGGCCDFLL